MSNTEPRGRQSARNTGDSVPGSSERQVAENGRRQSARIRSNSVPGTSRNQPAAIEEEIQAMQRANIRLEKKFLKISRGQDMLYLCEIPSSSWNDFMNERQDESVDMPSWEEWLHEQGFSWMTAIWQQMLAETFPSMASWPWKAQMKFLINFCHYQRRVRQSAKYHFVEFFAGNGNLSRELLRDGWEGVAVDIKYGTDHNLLSVRGLRLAINAVLETHSGALLWFGTPCSSFVKICRYSTKRSMDNGWMGDESHHSLACQEGNELMYVTLLLAILGGLNGNQVVIEQPCSSCFFVIPLVDFVMTRLLLSTSVKTYGGAFGLSTPKPMQLVSNNRRILDMARDFPSHTLGQRGCVDRDGPRYTGRHEDLQMSEEYTREFARALVECLMAGLNLRR